MRNFNKKKLVKVLRNANISASNAPPKTTKKKVLDKKKYAPEWKKKATLIPKSKDSNLIDNMKRLERPRPRPRPNQAPKTSMKKTFRKGGKA